MKAICYNTLIFVLCLISLTEQTLSQEEIILGGDYTLEMWILFDSTMATPEIIAEKDGQFVLSATEINPTRVTIKYMGNNSAVNSNGNTYEELTDVATNVWTHIVIGNSVTLGKGILMSEGGGGEIGYWGISNEGIRSQIYIGGDSNGNAFGGQIKEVRLWNVFRGLGNLLRDRHQVLSKDSFQLRQIWHTTSSLRRRQLATTHTHNLRQIRGRELEVIPDPVICEIGKQYQNGMCAVFDTEKTLRLIDKFDIKLPLGNSNKISSPPSEWTFSFILQHDPSTKMRLTILELFTFSIKSSSSQGSYNFEFFNSGGQKLKIKHELLYPNVWLEFRFGVSTSQEKVFFEILDADHNDIVPLIESSISTVEISDDQEAEDPYDSAIRIKATKTTTRGELFREVRLYMEYLSTITGDISAPQNPHSSPKLYTYYRMNENWGNIIYDSGEMGSYYEDDGSVVDWVTENTYLKSARCQYPFLIYHTDSCLSINTTFAIFQPPQGGQGKYILWSKGEFSCFIDNGGLDAGTDPLCSTQNISYFSTSQDIEIVIVGNLLTTTTQEDFVTLPQIPSHSYTSTSIQYAKESLAEGVYNIQITAYADSEGGSLTHTIVNSFYFQIKNEILEESENSDTAENTVPITNTLTDLHDQIKIIQSTPQEELVAVNSTLLALNTYFDTTENMTSILNTESMELIIEICENTTDFVNVSPNITPEDSSKINEQLYIILEKTTNIQSIQFENISNQPKMTPISIISTKQATKLLNITDILNSMNDLNESQIEKINQINNILLLCLETNLSIGSNQIINLKYTQIEITTQKGAIFDDKYEFANIEFPILSNKMNKTENYGISRTIWKFNPYATIFNSSKLAANMSSIKINSLSTYTEVSLTDLENPIKIGFTINDDHISEDFHYYCMYYDKANSKFSDYNLKLVTDAASYTNIVCETTHLSWYSVSSEPLVTIATENNYKMLYNLSALEDYKFWKSPIFWMVTLMSLLVLTVIFIFKRSKSGRVVPVTTYIEDPATISPNLNISITTKVEENSHEMSRTSIPGTPELKEGIEFFKQPSKEFPNDSPRSPLDGYEDESLDENRSPNESTNTVKDADTQRNTLGSSQESGRKYSGSPIDKRVPKLFFPQAIDGNKGDDRDNYLHMHKKDPSESAGGFLTPPRHRTKRPPRLSLFEKEKDKKEAKPKKQPFLAVFYKSHAFLSPLVSYKSPVSRSERVVLYYVRLLLIFLAGGMFFSTATGQSMGNDLSLWGYLLLTIICILVWAPLVVLTKYMLFSYTREEIKEQMSLAGELEDLSEEEEKIVLDNRMRRQKYFKIISVIILTLAILICLFLMNLLSANFGEDLSNAWMKGCLFAFLNDTFFAQTIKSLLVYFFLLVVNNPLLIKREQTLGFCGKCCSEFIFNMLLS